METGALGPEDHSEVRGPGISYPGCQVAAINMPTKKSNRTPSKDGDDYDELTFELEQQRRQNEAKDMALEAKDMALEYKDQELTAAAGGPGGACPIPFPSGGAWTQLLERLD